MEAIMRSIGAMRSLGAMISIGDTGVMRSKGA